MAPKTKPEEAATEEVATFNVTAKNPTPGGRFFHPQGKSVVLDPGKSARVTITQAEMESAMGQGVQFFDEDGNRIVGVDPRGKPRVQKIAKAEDETEREIA